MEGCRLLGDMVKLVLANGLTEGVVPKEDDDDESYSQCDLLPCEA